MTLKELIAKREAERAALIAERNALSASLRDAHAADDAEKVTELRTQVGAHDAAVDTIDAKIAELRADAAADDVADERAATIGDTAPAPKYDEVARVGAEARTYSPDTDSTGRKFVTDVARNFLYGDIGSRERLSRHMAEEQVERGQWLERAAGDATTGAFAGLTVPQYLVDLVAPNAKAGRPFADAIRKHPLPAQGMSVEISKITTGTSTAIQSSQLGAVSATSIDDTQLSISVQTNAGQQTVSRQAVERSSSALDIVLEDLFRSYGTTLDSTLLTQATNGLGAAATSIAYTDASPTAAELYPKLLAGSAAVEAALLDMDQADLIYVMHSRRWHWLQSQVASTWPTMAQPGIPMQAQGSNYGEAYGRGFRGLLPNGAPVIVDNNIPTNLGAGTNEDEIYVVAQSESHLWEDPNAPVFIRAEQTAAASLGVLLVAYGYFAYTFTRRAHAQRIGGTGLVTPTF